MKTIILAVLITFLSFFNSSILFSQVHQHEAPAGEVAGPQETASEEDADEEENTVEIEEEKQQLIGVRTVEASAGPMQKVIRTVGRIEYDERHIHTVNTKFDGWIEKLYVDYTGIYVKKGAPIAEIYSPELVATQQEFLNVLKWNTSAVSGQQSAISSMLSKDAEQILDAAKQRLRLWDITEGQIKAIEESGKPIRMLTIYSPANGYVVQKMALQGMRVMPGEKLFDIADLSTVWVISDIYEYELAFIKVGQTANISLSYFPGKVFSSTIDYIYPSISSDTRTAKIRFIIRNPSEQLKPQMFANVEIKIDMGRKLTIPDEAIIDTGTRKIIYVDKGEGYFEPREILTGLRADGMTEVTEGLKEGERVASSGTFLIDSEAQLKGIKPVKRHTH